jgi:hypothetical protein
MAVPETAQPHDKPAGITCEQYVRGEGKRCRHYLPSGACSRPGHFRCEEWLKVNAPKARPLEQHQLFEPPVPVPARAPTPAPSVARTPPSNVPAAAPNAATGIRCLTEADLASFKALGVEVRLESDSLGEVWLVPAYTGAERQELSVEHAVLLAAIGSVFPGAKVTAFGRPTAKSEPASSSSTRF